MLRLLTLALCLVSAVPAATLRQLSMDEMTGSATAIVRARITASSASLSGSTVYTHYRLQVSETLKGATTSEVDLPGGISGNIRQSFPGVPQLQIGTEYLLFLWTSRSTGITHLLGLTQGLFAVDPQSDGSIALSRARISETMHDAAGNLVQDRPVRVNLSDLRQRIRAGTVTGIPKGPVQ